MQDLSGTTIGRYHLLEKLGEGGMAIVYKAFDTRLERDVAFKMIRTDLFSSAVIARILKRFEREAKAMVKLSHANIVKVYEFGVYKESPYLVMELLPGGTLKQFLGAPMPYNQAASLLLPIARALNYAHEQKVIHRDVKPSNILLNCAGELVLTDFGIAKLLELEQGQTITGVGVGVGTPEYMALEQRVDREVNARADIYALGVVLYEMITGRTPYTVDTPVAVLLKQLIDPLSRPSGIIEDLPEEVEKVLLKALAKQLEDCYQNMGEFVSALAWLGREGKPGVVSTTARPMASEQIEDTNGTVDQLEPESMQSSTLVASQKEKDFVTSPRVERKEKNVLTAVVLGLLVVVVLITGWVNGWFSHSPTEVPNTKPTQPLIVISTQVSPRDGMVMVYVPAGEFSMGSDDGSDDEKPVHTVTLDAYWIDQTEVTNMMYEKCVSDRICVEPSYSQSYSRDSYYGNSTYANYPVIYVGWDNAKDYCQWAGRELPTEAQWEKAARGTDGQTYPWGNQEPTGNLVNFADINTNLRWSISSTNDGYEDTAPAGNYPKGTSPYGALDMAGNVSEWVADWDGRYPSGAVTNPVGPTSGEYKVLRGGAWLSNAFEIRSAYREVFWLKFPPSRDDIGFRCATSLP